MNITIRRGQEVHSSKISEETAQAILNAKGKMTIPEAVAAFADRGATTYIVGSIFRRKRWAHLKKQASE